MNTEAYRLAECVGVANQIAAEKEEALRVKLKRRATKRNVQPYNPQ